MSPVYQNVDASEVFDFLNEKKLFTEVNNNENCMNIYEKIYL